MPAEIPMMMLSKRAFILTPPECIQSAPFPSNGAWMRWGLPTAPGSLSTDLEIVVEKAAATAGRNELFERSIFYLMARRMWRVGKPADAPVRQPSAF